MRQAAIIGGGLRLADPDERPARRPVDGHEQVAPRRFVRHLRQILHVPMQVAGLVGTERLERRKRLECLMLGPWRCRQQITQIAKPMAAQTPVQTRTRDAWAEKLPERAIEGTIGSSPMASASRASIDTSSVLRRTTATASCADVSVVCRWCGVWLRHAPCPDVSICKRSARGDEALCQHRCRHGAGLDRRPNLRRCRRHCS